MRASAPWAIDSEPIRTQAIIVKYVSRTTSTPQTCWRWLFTNRRKTPWLHSMTVFEGPGFSIFTMATPSSRGASTDDPSTCTLLIFSRQGSSSDFVPVLSSPNWGNAGGELWFSWQQNVSRPPSRTWKHMSPENREQLLLFSDAMCSLTLD